MSKQLTLTEQHSPSHSGKTLWGLVVTHLLQYILYSQFLQFISPSKHLLFGLRNMHQASLNTHTNI